MSMDVVDAEVPPEDIKGKDEQETDANTTDECPPPPAYYINFTDTDSIAKIKPPLLEAMNTEGATLMNTIQNEVYGGLISSLQKRYTYSPNIDYSTSLIERVDGVLNVCMELANDVPPRRPIEESIDAIQASLVQVHELLGEYRHHEARSNLIKLRDAQIGDLLKLEKSIQDTIDEV